MDKCFGEVAARDARLIGDHEDGEMAVIQLADGRGNGRKHAKTRDMIEIPDFFGDSSVAIEEYRRFERVRHEGPPQRLARDTRLLRLERW